MVINRHGKDFFGVLLTNNILVQMRFDFMGFWDIFFGAFCLLAKLFTLAVKKFLIKNLVAKLHALVANIDLRACNQLFHRILRLAAK